MRQIKGVKIDNNDRVSSTDPEAKFMHHKNGLMPAYNGELAVTEDQIIVHAEVTNEPIDTNQLVPALGKIKDNCKDMPGKVVADAGFNSGKNLKELEERQIDGYIAESGEENIGKEPRGKADLYGKEDFQYDEDKDCYVCPAGEVLLPRQRSYHRTKYSQGEVIVYRTGRGICLTCSQKSKCTRSDNPVGRSINRMIYEKERRRMRQKLKTEEGKKIYKKRKAIVEPVIGQIKVVGQFVQFLLRGLMGARIEWKWATIAHNLLKLTRKIIGKDLTWATVS